METNFENVFDKVSENLKDLIKTETIIGEEFKIGEFTCKPVIKVGVGFGTGNGKGEKSNKNMHGEHTGAGAGMGITPVGFLASSGSEISFIPANSKNGLASVFEKVPDLMEKIMDMKNEKEKDKKN
jgi:uncharacterized spore protein YtfJ